MKIANAEVFVGGPGKNYVTLKIMTDDMALWDIKGKMAGLPLYQLFGGKSRDGALVYAHATGADLEDLIDSVEYMRYMPKVMDKLRDTFGFDLKLLHDVHHRLLPREAAE